MPDKYGVTVAAAQVLWLVARRQSLTDSAESEPVVRNDLLVYRGSGVRPLPLTHHPLHLYGTARPVEKPECSRIVFMIITVMSIITKADN